MTKTMLTIWVIGTALALSLAPSARAQTSGPWCFVIASGTLPNGDTFSGMATQDNFGDPATTPGSRWRHFEIDSSGTPVQVFSGRVEMAGCVKDGSKVIRLEGIGRLRGVPVGFVIALRDGNPDFYYLDILDSNGAIVYHADGNPTEGDIVASGGFDN
jgi:hypothetical protein